MSDLDDFTKKLFSTITRARAIFARSSMPIIKRRGL